MGYVHRISFPHCLVLASFSKWTMKYFFYLTSAIVLWHGKRWGCLTLAEMCKGKRGYNWWRIMTGLEWSEKWDGAYPCGCTQLATEEGYCIFFNSARDLGVPQGILSVLNPKPPRQCTVGCGCLDPTLKDVKYSGLKGPGKEQGGQCFAELKGLGMDCGGRRV